jgi:hypothetical protein
MSLRKRGLVALSILALVLAALVVLAPSLYEVQDRGRDILPYEDTGSVYEIQLLDTFTVYADGESRPIPDKLTGAALVAAATMTLMAALLLQAAGAGVRKRRFFALATLGLALLAADEMFALHETIGYNLGFLADLPGVQRPDDVLFLLEGLCVLGFAWAFRDVLLARRRATQLFVLGGAFFGVAAMGDLASLSVEEPAEVVAGGCLLAGLVVLTAAVLRRELGLGLVAPSFVVSASGDLDDPDRAGAPEVTAAGVADPQPVH